MPTRLNLLTCVATLDIWVRLRDEFGASVKMKGNEDGEGGMVSRFISYDEN